MFCGAILGDETAPQKACLTLSLQQAGNSETEEEAAELQNES